MPLWTLLGLAKGTATTTWPADDGDDGQAGVLGMPRLHTERCTRECRICADVCPTRAITFGNLNDAKSAVTAAKAEPHNYVLLAELNTRPRTSYLAEIRNPHPGRGDG